MSYLDHSIDRFRQTQSFHLTMEKNNAQASASDAATGVPEDVSSSLDDHDLGQFGYKAELKVLKL